MQHHVVALLHGLGGVISQNYLLQLITVDIRLVYK